MFFVCDMWNCLCHTSMCSCKYFQMLWQIWTDLLFTGSGAGIRQTICSSPYQLTSFSCTQLCHIYKKNSYMVTILKQQWNANKSVLGKCWPIYLFWGKGFMVLMIVTGVTHWSLVLLTRTITPVTSGTSDTSSDKMAYSRWWTLEGKLHFLTYKYIS